MSTISVTKGSRITYTAGGDTKTGTVYASERRRVDNPTHKKAYESVYRVAEEPNGVITKEQITDCRSPKRLELDVLEAIIPREVLDNIEQCRQEVARAKERPTFKPKAQRFNRHEKFTVVRI